MALNSSSWASGLGIFLPWRYAGKRTTKGLRNHEKHTKQRNYESMNRENDTLLYRELSYEIVGACFDAFLDRGPDQKERVYQRAVAVHLRGRNVRFREQVRYPLIADGVKISSQILDFVVEDKVVLELKARHRFLKFDYEQVRRYLTQEDYQLGILVRFSTNGT